MFDSPKVVLVGRVMIQRIPKKCIMVVNLERTTIEKFKVLSFIDTQDINCVAYGPFDNGHILLGLSDGWLLAYEYPSLERIESKQIFWEGSDEDEASLMNNSEIGANIENEEEKSNQTIEMSARSIVLDGDESELGGQSSADKRGRVSMPPCLDDQAIISIQIDPSNLILTCSRGGQVVALTPFERSHNYFYLELGEDTFCTVGLPMVRAKELGGSDTLALDKTGCCI